MENSKIVTALAALAQEHRLKTFRLLVQAGDSGVPAGKIAEQVGIAPSSLSFHLKELSYAGMVSSRQEGRSVIYTANYALMNQVIEFLTENCCQGVPCSPELSKCCTEKEVE
jgi:DNA-binding transcriptional ArsR family regulator